MSPLAAQRLNDTCFCVSVDQKALFQALDEDAGEFGFGTRLKLTHPHLFSATSVFISGDDVSAMMQTVHAIEAAARTETYRDAVLSWAPDIARHDFGPRGVFMGYDFHLSPEGPRLIEINTNAGGALLNAILRRAQKACCAEVEEIFTPPDAGIEKSAVAMFRREWTLQKGEQPLTRMAIVDDTPREQYLYPEFLLAKRLLERNGLDAIIATPDEFDMAGGCLRASGQPLDLVYNRVTDFYFETPEHATLRAAYLAGAAVVTPSPHHHALHANKRNLTLLSDPAFIATLGLGAEHEEALRRIPRTVLVARENADTLWTGRHRLFFKPLSGFGSKAVYRGDKLTRSTWSRILDGGYVAQELVTPSRRSIPDIKGAIAQKMDVRLYIYDGALLLVAARLYEGQTTNFRTPGGGFAPVIVK